MKTCSKCKQAKPFSDFALHRGRNDGHHSSCKICNRSQGQHKDWAFQEKRLMDKTAAIQRFLTTYRVGGESDLSN